MPSVDPVTTVKMKQTTTDLIAIFHYGLRIKNDKLNEEFIIR